jgi:glyoxylase-like metal-dependent hydrolase (beta-lactamase superfamily II)
MPTSQPPLKYDVFVAPEKPYTAPPPRVGDPPAWDPTTSTLIFGARDAILVESLMTIREATALADWVALHERRLTTIYVTHGHGDHYLGLPVVLDRFPGRPRWPPPERWSICARTRARKRWTRTRLPVTARVSLVRSPTRSRCRTTRCGVLGARGAPPPCD